MQILVSTGINYQMTGVFRRTDPSSILNLSCNFRIIFEIQWILLPAFVFPSRYLDDALHAGLGHSWLMTLNFVKI